MTSGAQNKQKARQSRKKEGWYKDQFLQTAKNKLRRKQRRARRKLEIPQVDVVRHAARKSRRVHKQKPATV